MTFFHILLVSSALDGARSIMTMSWHTVMEFGGNHSFDLIRIRPHHAEG
jgi:hypothetical protein